MPVDLLIPVKPLAQAKTRLRGAADGGAGADDAHARLVLALARDTVAAVAGAAVARRAVAICSDAVVCRALAEDGVETIPDAPAAGLNPALRYGESVLRTADPTTAIGVLQADLPALRPTELESALLAGLGTGRRAFCADRMGTGTTLLLAPAGQPLEPCFGPGSAAAHRASCALELVGLWPGLRCDVDTAADLARARNLGLGRFTRAMLAGSRVAAFPTE
ncbi:MAG: 2-phospho-L-lactate guanylyltransferase [Pseudonocardiaceae bacterium]